MGLVLHYLGLVPAAAAAAAMWGQWTHTRIVTRLPPAELCWPSQQSTHTKWIFLSEPGPGILTIWVLCMYAYTGSLDLLKSWLQLRKETKSKVDHFSYVTTSLAVSLIWSSAHMKLQKIHLQAKKIGCTYINITPGQFLRKCAAMCTAAKSLSVPAKTAKRHRIWQTEDLLVGSRVSQFQNKFLGHTTAHQKVLLEFCDALQF